MSRHLLVSFAILAIFCAMTLSSKHDGHDEKISHVEVVSIDTKHHGMDHGMDHGIGHGIGHGMDHGVGHGMDHGLGHQLDGHVDHLSLGHDQHIPLGHDIPLGHGIPIGHDQDGLHGHNQHELLGHDQHGLLGHDQHEIQVVKIPEVHEHEQPILLHGHDSHHDHGHHHCPKNEMWSKCGGHCEPSCKNRNPHCSKVCTAGCVCRKGLVRDAHHHCVKKCH
ncbi:histidine-rich glycoprotein-like [Osmia bicornis bicornis]|uniref:histidine-rich glycoprotein-like n=1 Tax=Osmia bicornis bicornis TaxID=1437191 RepID=UPI001EAEB6FD|nr:histidine-rich glycoprotein-like [Osmia bicornis bicornis]